jgi:hypothetical protein
MIQRTQNTPRRCRLVDVMHSGVHMVYTWRKEGNNFVLQNPLLQSTE